MRKIQLLANFRRANPRKRLWLGGSALGLVLLVFVVGNAFIPRDKAVTRQMLGHDFLAFYTAGSFVNQGRYRELYNLESVKAFEQATAHAVGLEVGESFGPWWNPPFYAIVFAPLARLPYPTALDLWRWIALAAGIIAIAVLASFVARGQPLAASQTGSLSICEAASGGDWRSWGLVPLLVIVSMPFLQAMSHGQNTFTSLLLLVTAVALWRSERAVLAGIIAGLLFYKPQLAAVVAVAMVFDLGWRAAVGFAITGSALLLVMVIAMPGAIADYAHLLPANVRWMQVEHTYLWERHVTLKAFWRLLLQGRDAGEMRRITSVLTVTSTLAVGGGLLWAVVAQWRVRGYQRENRGCHPRLCTDEARRDRLIAATIAAMPLLMPFYFDYDLLLLAVPVTLYAVERITRPGLVRSGDVWLTRAWVALYLWLLVNPGLAMRTHVNLSVVLLSCVAGMLIHRAGRDEQLVVMGTEPQIELAVQPAFRTRAA
jgi:hypothetical protein